MNDKKSQLLNLAEQYFRNGNYTVAEEILSRIINDSPNNSEANELLGYIYGNQGRIDDAYTVLKLACQQDNCSAEALFYLGLSQLKKGLYDQSVESFNKSILKAGIFFDALYNLATAYAHLGKTKESLFNYQECLKLNRNSNELYFNIARCLDDLKRYEEALFFYNQSIRLKPNYAEAYSNKGVILHELKRYDEAIACYNQSIELKPDYPEALSNKAASLYELKRYDEAITCYSESIRLKPDLDFIFGEMLHTKMRICDWSSFNESISVSVAEIKNFKKIILPFSLLALVDDLEIQKKCAEIYSQYKFPFNFSSYNFLRRSKNEKIRVAYFSADFKDHAVSRLMVSLFELHDKKKYEIFAFSYSADDKSFIRARLENAFDKFIDVSRKSDIEIVEIVRKMNIQIAVDLGGHTVENRLSIFSHRVAPLQVSYIGYIGTLGTNFIDYLIADNIVIPEECEKYYLEKIIRLPVFQVNDIKKEISKNIYTREQLGLPAIGFVFCCFNNNYKIIPKIFECWMRILKAVEGSILFLYAENDKVKNNLKKEATLRGVDNHRIIFGSQLDEKEYMARYKACDLFLDTFPYNAGATASDALMMNLPVLTYSGKSFVSRMAGSLLKSIGLEKLVAISLEDYENKAIYLATNPNELFLIKEELAINKLNYPLFNTELFARNLEKAYEIIHSKFINDDLPDNINIS